MEKNINMTQQDRELLLRDLCARLLCHVIVEYRGANIDLTQYARSIRIENCKPYLRPMSSMTAEEKEEYTSYCFEQPFLQIGKTPNLGSVPMCIDWLIVHHFDYRGLIPRGLALEAPKDMYKTK